MSYSFRLLCGVQPSVGFSSVGARTPEAAVRVCVCCSSFFLGVSPTCGGFSRPFNTRRNSRVALERRQKDDLAQGGSEAAGAAAAAEGWWVFGVSPRFQVVDVGWGLSLYALFYFIFVDSRAFGRVETVNWSRFRCVFGLVGPCLSRWITVHVSSCTLLHLTCCWQYLRHRGDVGLVRAKV